MSMASGSTITLLQLSSKCLNGLKYKKRTIRLIAGRHSTRASQVVSCAPHTQASDGNENFRFVSKKRRKPMPSPGFDESNKENVDPKTGSLSPTARSDDAPARKKHQNERLRETRQPLAVLWSKSWTQSSSTTVCSGTTGNDNVHKKSNHAIRVFR